jgi:hypothetical protein
MSDRGGGGALMRILRHAGSGVLGRSAVPLIVAAGHEVDAPLHGELDLFNASQVERPWAK